MSIYELKILFDLNPKSKTKILDKYAKEFMLGYFFVDSEDGHCYLLDRFGEEKDVSLVNEINEYMIPNDIEKIVISDDIMVIRAYAFCNCDKLMSVMIPNSVISIRKCAFFHCISLKGVTIPNNVTNIGVWAFYNCSGLMNVTIPDSVKNIGWQAFKYCSNLKSIIFKNKTMKQVRAMENYPFGIKDGSIIKAELS